MKLNHLVPIIFSCGKVFLNLMSGIGHPTFHIDIGEHHSSTIWIARTSNLYYISDFGFYQKIDHTVVDSGINYDDEIGVGQKFIWCQTAIFRCIGYDEPIGIVRITVPNVLSWYVRFEMFMEDLRCDANSIVRAFRSILGKITIWAEGSRRWKGQPSQIGPHWIDIIDCQILITLWYFLSHSLTPIHDCLAEWYKDVHVIIADVKVLYQIVRNLIQESLSFIGPETEEGISGKLPIILRF